MVASFRLPAASLIDPGLPMRLPLLRGLSHWSVRTLHSCGKPVVDRVILAASAETATATASAETAALMLHPLVASTSSVAEVHATAGAAAAMAAESMLTTPLAPSS